MGSEPVCFVPPYCPRPECDSHRISGAWRFVRKGFYRRESHPRRIQRYRCTRCGRNFSSQTFSTDYWLKRPELQRPVFFRILACSALRQIAQEYRASPSTIMRHVERLGRHCLLLHETLRPKEAPHEPLVVDGLRSFEAGQYWPFDLNLLVGRSHYVYGFSEAELRRSGRMTKAQRHARARLEARHGRPDPGATRRSIRELIERIVPVGSRATIHSDEQRDYGLEIQALGQTRSLRHETISSRAPRTPQNPLFPVNLADLLMRHTGANHKRETIAFSKRRQGAMYRAAIFAVWRNYIKPVSERRRDAPAGVRIGVIARRLSLGQLLAERLMPWRTGLRGWLEGCYYGRIPTRRLGRRCVEHCKRYAM